MTWGYYVLDDDGRPLALDDVLVWARWFEHHDRHVALDTIGDVRVSTVFLGLDHKFGAAGGDPVLWETMIFGGPHDAWCRRYTSHAAALTGHLEALALALAAAAADVSKSEA